MNTFLFKLIQLNTKEKEHVIMCDGNLTALFLGKKTISLCCEAPFKIHQMLNN